MYILLLVRVGLFFYTLYTALDGNMWNISSIFLLLNSLNQFIIAFLNLVNLNWALESPVVDLWDGSLCSGAQASALTHLNPFCVWSPAYI